MQKPFSVDEMIQGIKEAAIETQGRPEGTEQDTHDPFRARTSSRGKTRRDEDHGDSSSPPPRPEDNPPSPPEDPINPSHYRRHPSGIECIEITRHMNFNVGNAIKYLWRYLDKGDPIENLQKAQWYIDDEIRRLQGLR